MVTVKKGPLKFLLYHPLLGEDSWDCGFESSRDICVSLNVSVMYCQVEVSASD